MVFGLPKLSEYQGQEHITSVLRASVIKNQPITKLTILGDEALAADIGLSYVASLNCEDPRRGDYCDRCDSCDARKMFSYNMRNGLPWFLKCVTDEADPAINVISLSYDTIDGFTKFILRSAVGTYIDVDMLTLLIYAFQSTKTDTLTAARKLSKSMSFEQFLTKMVDILTNILYLKSNLEVLEVDKIEALRTLAVRMSTQKITASLRLLWDAQDKTVLSDPVRIEMLSLLLSEALQPTPAATVDWNTAAVDGKTPIQVIEEDNLEQPLDLERMLEIAHE